MKMKNLKYTAYIIGIAAMAAGCSALDQRAQSSFDAEACFKSYELSRYAVNAIYESYVATNSYRNDQYFYYGVNTDIEMVTATDDAERNAIGKYKVLPTNSYLNKSTNQDFYPGNFIGIERANNCIINLKKYGDILNEPRMGALYGEALVARALLYIDLMNNYGEVPARFEPVTNETMYLPKSDRDVLYKQLLSDLEEAQDYLEYEDLPAITTPGKACAQGMYARIALQACGYSLRPEKGKVNTGNPGTVRKSDDPELQASVLLPKALTGLKELIASNSFKLTPKFEDLWHKYYCNLHTEVGQEVIFGHPNSSNRGQHIALNGVPNKKYNHGASSGRNGVVGTLYFKYPEWDTRRDVTCCPVKFGEDGTVDESAIKSSLWYCGKWRFDWMEEHPFASKSAEDGAKYTVLRYADILLMAAEISNELGNVEDAKNYMRPVLMRAYANNETKVDEYLNGIVDAESCFEAVKEQRALEFAGENLRKMDLIRWGILQKTLDDEKVNMQNMKELTGIYTGLNDKLYWRYKPGCTDTNIEFKFIKTEDVAPSSADGWKSKSDYFSKFDSKAINNLYLEGYDPDKKMYRPIPDCIIIASMGTLVNDYGY